MTDDHSEVQGLYDEAMKALEEANAAYEELMPPSEVLKVVTALVQQWEAGRDTELVENAILSALMSWFDGGSRLMKRHYSN